MANYQTILSEIEDCFTKSGVMEIGGFFDTKEEKELTQKILMECHSQLSEDTNPSYHVSPAEEYRTTLGEVYDLVEQCSIKPIDWPRRGYLQVAVDLSEVLYYKVIQAWQDSLKARVQPEA